MIVLPYAPTRLRMARGTVVRVERGCIWMTQEGRHEDVSFHAGRTCEVMVDGLTVLTAGFRQPAVVTLMRAISGSGHLLQTGEVDSGDG
ncbi:DUF2917 domain-containing protein [Variovorax flavidus]|uniref:DUF2917 domain-containing protein n=1 Tax=Variovorax flavidus TaxID=3053501 RepID=UPI00336533E6